MRVLITGGSGQLGREVVRLLQQCEHEVLVPKRELLDFLQPQQVAEFVTGSRPDFVINCAAYTQVDRAESEPDTVFVINRDAAGSLAEAVAQTGGRLLHVSTDFVFDGKLTRPYRETDLPDPLSVYGHSKLAGEQAVQAALPDALILRTAWVYGSHGHNFVKTMLRLAGEGKPLRVVDDQWGAPTWAADIADVIVRLLNHEASGLFHFTNAGSTTWHGFACAILEKAQAIGFNIKTEEVEPIPTSGYPTPAKRPAYSVLDTAKITSLLSLSIPDWHDSLNNMLEELHTCADCW